MGELSIKIKIGDREYPMRVEAEEEERIRRAGRLVNEQLRAYHDRFGTTDKQDLLAMVAFDAYMQKLEHELAHHDLEKVFAEKVASLNKLISRAVT